MQFSYSNRNIRQIIDELLTDAEFYELISYIENHKVIRSHFVKKFKSKRLNILYVVVSDNLAVFKAFKFDGQVDFNFGENVNEIREIRKLIARL